jgi:hypothetical protein
MRRICVLFRVRPDRLDEYRSRPAARPAACQAPGVWKGPFLTFIVRN